MKKPPPIPAPVRKLGSLVRQFMITSDEFEDVGKTTSAEMFAWVVRSEIAAQWEKADEAIRERVCQEWERLRGKTIEESAEGRATRYNARLREKHSLFAAMGALDEIAKEMTPQDAVEEHREMKAHLRKIAEMSAEIDRKYKAKREVSLNQSAESHMSINEGRVWTHLFRMHFARNYALAHPSEPITTCILSAALAAQWRWRETETPCECPDLSGMTCAEAMRIVESLWKNNRLPLPDEASPDLKGIPTGEALELAKIALERYNASMSWKVAEDCLVTRNLPAGYTRKQIIVIAQNMAAREELAEVAD